MRLSVVMMLGAFSIGVGGCAGDGMEEATEEVGTAVAATFAIGPQPHGFVMDGAAVDEQVGTAVAACGPVGPPVHGFVMDDGALDEQLATAASDISGEVLGHSKRPERESRW